MYGTCISTGSKVTYPTTPWSTRVGTAKINPAYFRRDYCKINFCGEFFLFPYTVTYYYRVEVKVYFIG